MQLIPLDPATRRLGADAAAARLAGLEGWSLASAGEELCLRRDYPTADFASAFALAAPVAALAARYDHHPVLCIRWGGLEVRWWTHALQGLHENDFLMAAATDAAIAAAAPAGA